MDRDSTAKTMDHGANSAMNNAEMIGKHLNLNGAIGGTIHENLGKEL